MMDDTEPGFIYLRNYSELNASLQLPIISADQHPQSPYRNLANWQPIVTANQ